MNYRYLKINPALKEYVQAVLVFDGSSAKTAGLPLFTKGMPALLCRTGNDNNRITVFGQSIPENNWTLESNITLIVFFFMPFAASSIFNLSARELKENPVELRLWNDRKAGALQAHLVPSKSTEAKVEILSRFIQAQIKINRRVCEIVRYATDQLMQNTNAAVLTQIIQELNLTERTFQRIFKKHVGISANEYRRICQFYFAFSQLKGGHFDKLTDIAYTNGYFDQSHYIRSFKEFAEITPNEYLQSGLPKKTG